jgi:LCP family protein required for cell wall assembly
MPPRPNGGPGHRSMPPRPNGVPGTNSMPPHANVPLPPPRQPVADADRDIDPVCMTTEMEAVGEATQKRRQVDHTLARFSKVHDELKAEERARKAKRKKLFPWATTDDELDYLDEIVGMQTPGPAVPQAFQEDAPEPERAPAPQDTRSKGLHRSALAGKAFAAAAAVLVFLATGAAWGFKKWVEGGQQQVDALAGGYAVQDPAAQRGDENFLLVGSDVRPGGEAEETGVIGARSDTLMIAHIPANRERAVVVSFPRDTQVDRPRCERWDSNTNSYTGQQDPGDKNVKLNSAYAVGGPKCVTKMVQELTGLEINHFVGINFDGFKGMVDAVGGVEVCVESPMKDKELGVIVPEAGKNVTITGDQALSFVRARSVYGDKTADYGRIKRQQRFLSSLLRKAMSSEVLLDPGKLTNFVEAFSKSTYGDNIGVDQLMLLGQSMQGLSAGRVTFVTVPTVGEANQLGNEELRKEDTDALFKAIRDDAPLPGEKPAQGGQQAQPGGTQQGSQPAQAGPVDPKTIKIQVLNGGNPTPRIATRAAEKLDGFGFQVMQVENAPAVPKTVVRYAKGKEAAAQTLAASVPGAQLQEDPSLAGALLLVIGPEFTGEVVAPKATAADLPDDLSTVNAGDVDCA